MRKLLVLTILLMLAGRADASVKVAVTIKPLHSLVTGVMGDIGTPALIVGGGNSLHDFQLRPSQMRELQKAKLVFYIGDSFETFLVNALKSLPSDIRRVPVARQAELNLLPLRKGGAWEEDADEISIGADAKDMHVWLDPRNAIKIVSVIESELSQADPDNAPLYKKNAAGLKEKLSALDVSLEKEMQPLRGKPFVVFHDAYQYFDKRYGLMAVGSITLEPHESPSAVRLQSVRKKIMDTNAACVFREPKFSDRMIRTVTEGVVVQSGTLDPEGQSLKEGPELYFQLMQNLSKNLRKCLLADPSP